MNFIRTSIYNTYWYQNIIIISDLPIETLIKEEVYNILFCDLDIRKKRIAIRKLKNKKLDAKYVKVFLKLLEYIEQV